jgi:hypothetical protein
MSFRTVHFLSREIKIAETVVNESGQRTKYTMLPPSDQEEDSTMIEDRDFVF